VKQSGKGKSSNDKRKPVVVPKLQIPTNVYIAPENGAKSSIRSISRRNELIRQEEKQKTDLTNLLNVLNDAFGFNITPEMVGTAKYKEILDEYREKTELLQEELLSKINELKSNLKQEREKYNAAKGKIKLMSSEMSMLREKVKTNKENDVTHKSLTSQLLAYQILHKKDMETKKQLNDELSKAYSEIAELKKKSKNTDEGIKSDLNLQSENDNLKAKNEALSLEYKRLKEDMDETVHQLLVFLYMFIAK